MATNKRKGNGYVELAVVVAVLLVINLFVIPRYQDLKRDAYRAQIANDSKLVEAHVAEKYSNTGEMPKNSQIINDTKLKEVIGNNKSYYKAEELTDSIIDSIGGEKYLLDKNEVLKYVNTKLKGDFIYTDKGVIYVDSKLNNNSNNSELDGDLDEDEDEEQKLINKHAKEKGLKLKDLAYNGEYIYEPYRSRIDSAIEEYYQSAEYAYSLFSIDSYYERALNKINNIKQVDNRRKADVMERLFAIDNDFIRSGVRDEVNQLFQEAREKADKVLDSNYYIGIEPEREFYKNLNKIIEEYLIKVRGVRGKQKPFPLKDVDIFNASGLAVTTDGKLYAWGTNTYDGIGRSRSENTKYPSEQLYFVDNGIKVNKVARGDNSSAIITTDGELYTWGAYYDTPLGREKADYITDDGYEGSSEGYPAKVEFDYYGNPLPKFKDVKLGRRNSIALSVDGDVYAWGKNDNTPIGLTQTGLIDRPHKIDFDVKIEKIFAEHHTFAAIDTEGTLYGWGDSSNIRISGGNGIYVNTPTEISVPEKVKDIDMSENHMLILTESGDVYGLGTNIGKAFGEKYRMTLNEATKITELSNVDSVHAASEVSIIQKNNALYTIGLNDGGLLANGESKDSTHSRPTKVQDLSNLNIRNILSHYGAAMIINEDGTLYVWGVAFSGIDWFNENELYTIQPYTFLKQ